MRIFLHMGTVYIVLKYSIVFESPSFKRTDGSQLRCALANAISGCLCFGSSEGNGLKTIREVVPVNSITFSARCNIVNSLLGLRGRLLRGLVNGKGEAGFSAKGLIRG